MDARAAATRLTGIPSWVLKRKERRKDSLHRGSMLDPVSMPMAMPRTAQELYLFEYRFRL